MTGVWQREIAVEPGDSTKPGKARLSSEGTDMATEGRRLGGLGLGTRQGQEARLSEDGGQETGRDSVDTRKLSEEERNETTVGEGTPIYRIPLPTSRPHCTLLLRLSPIIVPPLSLVVRTPFPTIVPFVPSSRSLLVSTLSRKLLPISLVVMNQARGMSRTPYKCE